MKMIATKLFAIRVPDGTWWKRGGGVLPGETVEDFKYATLYKNPGAAKTAAIKLRLEETYGGWCVMEMILAVGTKRLEMTCG